MTQIVDANARSHRRQIADQIFFRSWRGSTGSAQAAEERPKSGQDKSIATANDFRGADILDANVQR
jgi:hypothetical protein